MKSNLTVKLTPCGSFRVPPSCSSDRKLCHSNNIYVAFLRNAFVRGSSGCWASRMTCYSGCTGTAREFLQLQRPLLLLLALLSWSWLLPCAVPGCSSIRRVVAVAVAVGVVAVVVCRSGCLLSSAATSPSQV